MRYVHTSEEHILRTGGLTVLEGDGREQSTLVWSGGASPEAVGVTGWVGRSPAVGVAVGRLLLERVGRA